MSKVLGWLFTAVAAMLSVMKVIYINVLYIAITSAMPSIMARLIYHFSPENEFRFIINGLPIMPYYFVPIFALIYYANFKLAPLNISHRKEKIIFWSSIGVVAWLIIGITLVTFTHFYIGGHK